MRSLILTVFLLLSTQLCLCQQDFLRVPEEATDDVDKRTADYTQLYYRGAAEFEKRNYSRAESIFRKAFGLKPCEEAARYYYYALLYQGYDLEAEYFRRRSPAYSYSLPKCKRGLESVYADAGPRLSANEAADEILYGDAGAFSRLSPCLRLWTALSFLQQDKDLGQYKQYEGFSSLNAYIGRGWYIRPSVHYAYVPYTFIVQDTASVAYSQSYPVGRDDTMLYKTSAIQTVTTTSPGRTHFFNGAIALSKRICAFSFEAEPSLHVMAGHSSVQAQYISTGTTDSFRNNRRLGSKPFFESGGSNRDTTYQSSFAQLGAAVSYRLPMRGEPLAIRVAAFVMRDEAGTYATAYHFSAVLWWHTALRTYLSWMQKGEAPLALHSEGMYFNFNDPIRTRASATFQFFPLRHFSPGITYQFEKDKRLADDATLLYHSIYLTLKYNL